MKTEFDKILAQGEKALEDAINEFESAPQDVINEYLAAISPRYPCVMSNLLALPMENSISNEITESFLTAKSQIDALLFRRNPENIIYKECSHLIEAYMVDRENNKEKRLPTKRHKAET